MSLEEKTPESVAAEAVERAPLIPSLKERLLSLLMHPKAPLIVGGALMLGLGLFAMHKMHLTLPFERPAIVVFDPVRFLNAQRAAASIMAVNPTPDLALTMTQVAKQSEAVIKDEAHGAIVLIKQSVVIPDDVPDITDAVLQRFGLPTSVPTVSTRPSQFTLEGVAPTDSSLSVGKLREDYRLELQHRSQQLLSEDSKRTQQEQAIP